MRGLPLEKRRSGWCRTCVYLYRIAGTTRMWSPNRPSYLDINMTYTIIIDGLYMVYTEIKYGWAPPVQFIIWPRSAAHGIKVDNEEMPVCSGSIVFDWIASRQLNWLPSTGPAASGPLACLPAATGPVVMPAGRWHVSRLLGSTHSKPNPLLFRHNFLGWSPGTW